MNERVTEVLASKEYAFLKENEMLRENVLYLVLSGSYGYGTNNQNSDIDLRGILVEDENSLFKLGVFEQYEDEKTDTVIYGLKKFVRLALNGNPNTLELLGVEEDCIYRMTDSGRLLRENAKLFLSRRVVESFGGYALAQLRRIQNALSHDTYDAKMREKHICDTLNKQLNHFNRTYTSFDENSIELMILEEPKPDIYMNIKLSKYPLRDFTSIYAEMTNTVRSYEKLTHRNNKKDENKLYKHAMHLVRLLLTGQFILEENTIKTKFDKELSLLLDIRNGQYSFDEIFKIVDEREKAFYKAAKESSLPESPRQKDVEELMAEIYKKHYRII